jgi:quercetin dioxygenase-like cupin family protein
MPIETRAVDFAALNPPYEERSHDARLQRRFTTCFASPRHGSSLERLGGFLAHEGSVMRKAVLTTLLLSLLPAASLAADEHTTAKPDTLNWIPVPPGLPAGAEAAVLSGDPSQEGLFVVRVRMPGDYKVPPHTHPTDENLTVISGTFHVAMGGKFDTGKSETLGAGGFAHMPKNTQHYAWSAAPTIIQIEGMGPFVINYVDPADDPRTAATTGSK